VPVVVAPPPHPAHVAFENPGGMWMPAQMTGQAAKLKELGLKIDPSQLSDPTSNTLSAVVSLGGCSASFVSPDGLVITNHHCVQAALQNNSTPDKNLIHDGYLAKTHADELSAGPTQRVYVTRAVTDVTTQVLAGIEQIKDDLARFKKIESRQKDLVAACEKGRPGVRCSVPSFYEGAQFFQIEQLEIRDVRLVYAPPASIGNYGGEIDNWRWPRHAGDFSFYRAYVGKDGQPADYSPDNQPYHSTHFLKIADKPLDEGSLVMVAGYPGRTYSLKTKPEVDEAISWTYPRRQKYCEDYLATVDAIASDPDVKIKSNTLVRGLGNGLTNFKGQLEGLVKGGLAAQKAKTDEALGAVAANATLMANIAKVFGDHAKYRDADAEVRELSGAPRLLGAASTIVRMAEERAKKDADRDPDFQERNWKRLEQAQTQLEKGYNPKLDRALMVEALKRVRDEQNVTPAFKAIMGSTKPSDDAIAKKVDAVYSATKLEPAATRLGLLQKATTAQLKASTDPLMKIAVLLRPYLKAAEDRDETYTGKMALLKPAYISALRALRGADIAPDANSTLRITYGTVRGYRPRPDADVYRPFTLLPEVVAKATGKEPFDAPQALIDAVAQKKFGPYVDPWLNQVPVDFLADLHITGGNSGSATIDENGQLVGLAFDGNYEAMASDWVFTPISRSIHVDIRYVLWVLDAVSGADALLAELGRARAIH
jgi:hypothetical protein